VKESDSAGVSRIVEKLVSEGDPYPRVFFAKSAQRQQNAGDRAHCELRRVCKRLKTKGCVLRAAARHQSEVAHIKLRQVMTGPEG